MRSFFIASIFYLITSSMLIGQFRTVPLRLYETKKTTADTTLSLPFWEDFSTSGNTPDTLRWSYGYDVFVNDGLGQNPPTYKVATLDGLRGDGAAYNIETSVSGITDSLVSQKINLEGLGASDNVYMSFFWQAGGYGEMPDEEDSLSLLFFNNSGKWETVWSTNGGFMGDNFEQEILAVSAARFMHAGFKFKFQAHGNIAGPFDTWHLDYIYINRGRNANDLTHLDRAYTGIAGPIFGDYSYVPARVFFESPSSYNLSQTVMASNLDNTLHSLDFFYRLENLTTNEIYIDSIHPIQSMTALSMIPISSDSVISLSDSIIAPQLSPLDSQVIRSTFYMNSGDKFLFEETNASGDSLFSNINLKTNDTLRNDYTLQNFYAYDDGTAEYASGINSTYGELAVKYVLRRPDTLSHIDICFPSIAPTAVGESISVIVWKRLNDESILAVQSHTILQDTKPNTFQRIRLSEAKLVQDTIYIGFRQLREDYIGVGFDRSNPAAMGNIFTKTSTTWQQNDRLEGIFMVRPVFDADSTFVLATKREEPKKDFALYPNPSTGSFSIEGQYNKIEVYNLSGSLIYQSSKRENYKLTAEPGLYVVRIFSKDAVQSKRLIIR